METILVALLTILLTAILGAAGYFLKKIFDRTETIGKDVSDMKPKLDILWKDKIAPAHSPRQLNERGNSILNTSAIKQIVDQKKDDLLRLVRERNTTNAYDAEVAIYSVMEKLPEHCPDVIDKLKQGAFQSGVDVNTVLFAGSIYLRNLIFSDLGFSLDDLDRPRSSDKEVQ